MERSCGIVSSTMLEARRPLLASKPYTMNMPRGARLRRQVRHAAVGAPPFPHPNPANRQYAFLALYPQILDMPHGARLRRQVVHAAGGALPFSRPKPHT